MKTYEEWGFEVIKCICDTKGLDPAIKVMEIKCVVTKDGLYPENYNDGDSPRYAWASELDYIVSESE